MFSSLLCNSYPVITNSQKLLFNSNASTTASYWSKVNVTFLKKPIHAMCNCARLQWATWNMTPGEWHTNKTRPHQNQLRTLVPVTLASVQIYIYVYIYIYQQCCTVSGDTAIPPLSTTVILSYQIHSSVQQSHTGGWVNAVLDAFLSTADFDAALGHYTPNNNHMLHSQTSAFAKV